MRDNQGRLGVAGLVLCWGVLGCGGGDDAPKSTIMTSNGGGGMGGAGGLSLGNGGGGKGGKAGAGGSDTPAAGSGGGGIIVPNTPVPTIELHTCPATPEPACPAKSLPGDVSASSLSALEALEGVTAVEGNLSIRVSSGFDSLHCLESVGGDLDVETFAADEDLSWWGLRNVKTVGGSIDLLSPLDLVYPDCGFMNLQDVGGAVDVAGDIAGQLDLSALKKVTHIRFRASKLSRVVLPSNVTLSMGQLLFENDKYLSDIAGFTGVTIQSQPVGGTYSVRIIDNPFLSMCRANALAKMFVDGGSPASTVTVTNNLPCE